MRRSATQLPRIQGVTALLLIRGAMAKPGAGACCVRGHSNVQGGLKAIPREKPRAVLKVAPPSVRPTCGEYQRGILSIEARKKPLQVVDLRQVVDDNIGIMRVQR